MKKSFRQRDKYDLRDESIGKRLTVVCKKNCLIHEDPTVYVPSDSLYLSRDIGCI